MRLGTRHARRHATNLKHDGVVMRSKSKWPYLAILSKFKKNTYTYFQTAQQAAGFAYENVQLQVVQRADGAANSGLSPRTQHQCSWSCLHVKKKEEKVEGHQRVKKKPTTQETLSARRSKPKHARYQMGGGTLRRKFHAAANKHESERHHETHTYAERRGRNAK